MIKLSASPSRTWNDDAPVVQSIALLVLLSLILLATVSMWTSNRANELALTRELRLAENALEQTQKTQLALVHDLAVSDDGYRTLHLSPDRDTLAAALARQIGTPADDATILIFGPASENGLAIGPGGRLNDHETLRLVKDLGPLVQPVRDAAYVRPPARNTTTGGDATEARLDAAFWAVIDGRPALVAAAVIRPAAQATRRPGAGSILVSVTPLGDGFLARLGHAFVLPELTFLDMPKPASGAVLPSASMVLKNGNGQPIGAIAWVTAEPGQWMLRNLAPPTLAASFVVIGFALFVVKRFRSRVQDIAQKEADAKHFAFHDTLSGLANRPHFNQKLDAALAAVRLDPARAFSVVYVDLDRFKDINDTLGHQAGDEVIKVTAQRMAAIVGSDNLAARIAGDEFALLISTPTGRAEIEALLQAIVEAIGQPIPYGERIIYPGGSVGCAMAPQDGTDRAELLHRADLALYRAKAAGRGRWLIYSIDMDDGHRKRQVLRQDLRSAIAEDRLTMLYQPFFNIHDMSVAGVEARVAWNHPIRGRIPAAEFIPVAEESGMIRELGAWVLRQACRDAAQWPAMTLAINVSPSELRHANFADDLLRTILEAGFEPNRLQVDLTENVLLADADVAISVIERLRAAGVKIALDEFGSGQSSFNYLSRFRFDLLKIDRSVIARVETSNEVATIIGTMVDLARKLGLKTAAEGVETFGQFRFMKSLGCDTVQGHLCARPMPTNDLAVFIAQPEAERLKIVAQSTLNEGVAKTRSAAPRRALQQ